MRMRSHWLASLALIALTLPAAGARADEIEAPDTGVPQQAEPATELSEAARFIAPDNPGGWADPPGETAIEDWKSQNPWGYGIETIFPLTRGVAETDLPLWAKIPIYPLTGAADLLQLPIGALGGLWGS